MTTYVDEPRKPHDRTFKGLWCHMWTDGDERELHAIARQIGLSRSWFQIRTDRFRHYDLSESKRALALMNGAVFMPLKEWVERGKNNGLHGQTETGVDDRTDSGDTPKQP